MPISELMLKVLSTTMGVKTMKMNALDKTAMLLLIIGGLNWGLVGWWKYNLVDKLFGVESGASRIIYAVVGLASLYCILGMARMMGGPVKKS